MPPSPNDGPEEPDLHEGFMWKEGHIAKTWRRRFFVVERGVLEYFENMEGGTALGRILPFPPSRSQLPAHCLREMRRGTTVLLATEVYGGTAPRAAVAGGGADGQQNSREAEAARASETRASESSSRRRTLC